MLLELRPRRDADARRVRRRRPRRGPHVRRRGAGLPRGPAGPAVRRPGRQAPGAAARVHRHDARAGLHRQRPQEPAAQQPRPAPRGDRRLPAVPVAADRDHPAQGHLHAGQLRDQAAERGPARHHQGARAAARDGDRGAPALPVPDLPSGRRAVHAGQSGDAQRGLSAAAGAPGARRAGARGRGGRAAGRAAAGLAAARPSARADDRAGARRFRAADARGRRADARAGPPRRRPSRRRTEARGCPRGGASGDCRDGRSRRPRSPSAAGPRRIRQPVVETDPAPSEDPAPAPVSRRRPLRRPVRPPNRSSSASSR